jgi:catechol 2,3-dioxygenase-like lactoylglutathione lyase family enzyme
METTASPYAYIAAGLHQIAYVVRDITAAQTFFTAHLGTSRFHIAEDVPVEEPTYRGQPGNFRLHIALAYAGETQIELIQPLSGESIYQEFLDRKGEGLHHLGFIVDDYDKAISDFTGNGYPVIQSGRLGRNPGVRFAYFDTEAAIGSIMEIFVLDERTRQLFDRIKRGEL